MPFHLGVTELILIVVIILFVFGAGKLPVVGNMIGKGVREFRKTMSGKSEDKV